jgi:hypothetical protein
MRTDGRTDMTTLTVACRSFADAPKNDGTILSPFKALLHHLQHNLYFCTVHSNSTSVFPITLTNKTYCFPKQHNRLVFLTVRQEVNF